MRSLAGCCGLVMVAVLTNAPSSAHAAQWCAQYQTGGTNCGFTTIAQCQAAISGMGGMCNQSPYQDAQPARRATAPSKQTRSKTAVRRPEQPAASTTRAPAVPTLPAAAVPAAPAPATIAPAAIAAQPNPGEFAAARKLILDGQYQAGLAAMRALRADNNPDVASYIGLALRKLGRHSEARAWYDKALAADPKHLQTLAFYGVLLAEQGDLSGARLDLAKIKLICGNTNCNEYVGLAGVIAAKAR